MLCREREERVAQLMWGPTLEAVIGAMLVPPVDFEVEPGSLGPGGWYEKNMRNGALIGLTVYYDTPDPGSTGYYAAYYRVHWMGDEPGWGKWEYGDDDDGAGNDVDQIDMVELTICAM